ncbi:Cysteine desulfurase, mitochondrial, partial [Araneus ventricosus]
MRIEWNDVLAKSIFSSQSLTGRVVTASASEPYDSKRIDKLSERLVNGIMSQIPEVIRNGDPEMSYTGCVNLSFAYIEGESLLMALKDIALSSGSACTSASLEPSYVLRAIGSDEDLAHSSI